MRVRPIEPEDVEAVLEIQAASPEAAQWTAWDYERVARGEMAGWVAEADGQVVGFLIARLVAMDLEILNVAVHPHQRRSRFGTGLLDKLLASPASAKAENVFLEVRESNSGAIRFYEKRGFTKLGQRKGYYRDPMEDALLLQRRMPRKPA